MNKIFKISLQKKGGSMTSLVTIVSGAQTRCEGFSSTQIEFKRMEYGYLSELSAIFNDPINYSAYGRTEKKSLEEMSAIVERDISRPIFTGYAMFSKASRALIGRAAIGSGYHPDKNLEGAYQAAPLLDRSDEAGRGPAEVQIGDFLVSDSAKLIGSREAFYKEMLLALINQVSEHIVWRGEKQNGQIVTRVTITVINPEKSTFEGIAQEDLMMRHRVIREIFGEHIGVLFPKSLDPRNYSEHERFVFGCDKEDLTALLETNGIF
jgi:hypothetical protein